MDKFKGLLSTTGVETSSSSVSSSWHKLSNCPAPFDEFFIGDEVVGRSGFPVPMETPKCVVPVPPRGWPNFESSGKARMEALKSDDTSKLSLFALGLKEPVFGRIWCRLQRKMIKVWIAITLHKVKTLWEGHKIWKNHPPVLTEQLFLLSTVKTSGRFFQIFVDFSEKLDFNRDELQHKWHFTYLSSFLFFFIRKWYARQIYLVDKSVWCKTTCKGLQGINMLNYHQTRFWQKYTYVLYTVPVWWRKTLET